MKQVSIDDKVVVRRLEAGDVNGRSRHSRDRDVAVAVVSDLNVIVIVDEDGVGRPIAISIHPEVYVELGNSATRRIIDVNVVGATQRVESDLLHTGQVHRDIAKIAREQSPAAGLGRKGEVLSPGTAVEQHGVEPRAAVQPVAAVPGVPNQQVVASASEHVVGAGAADQGVIAIAAGQHVASAAALQSVIPIPAKQLVIARAADQGVVTIVGRSCGIMLNEVEIMCEIKGHFQSLSLIVMVSPQE